VLPLTFDIITGETKASKRLAVLSAFTPFILLGLLLGKLNQQLKWLLPACYAFMGLQLLLLLVFRKQFDNRFILGGTVVFTEAAITVGNLVLPLAELRKVEAHFTFAKGESAGPSGFGDLSNNLLICTKQPESLRFKLLVKSRAQRVVLDGLLRRWRQQGLAVVIDVY